MADDNRVDWTLSEAPAASEWPAEPPPSAPLGPRRARPRRAWLIVAALPILALLFTWLYGQWETARLRRAVTAVVASEEQARLASDWNQLRGYYADDAAGWADARIQKLRTGTGGLPLPMALPGYWLAREAGQVTQFEVVGAQQARADVTRVFQSLEGDHIRVTQPQFYKFINGAWRETAPPAPEASEARALHGVYVDVDYFPADAALAASLRDDLDRLLATACRDWSCPADLRVPVRFETGDTFEHTYSETPDIYLYSWTLQVMAARQSGYLVREVTLPTGLEGGYSADAAAADAVRRVAGITALLRAAQRVAARNTKQGDNVFLEALVVREAARLGLDAPELVQAQQANPLFTPPELWSLAPNDYQNASAGAEALVILNHLLAGRTLPDEWNLLHTLQSASAPDAWLAAGLGLPLAQAQASLAAATVFGAPPPRAQAPSFAPDLALNCIGSGPLLANLAGQTAPLFAASVRAATVRDWSLRGQRLAVSIAGRLGMVDLAGAGAAWAPQPALPNAYPVRWASDTVLAYPPLIRDPLENSGLPMTRGLNLWDTATGQALATEGGDIAYAARGQWAALVGEPYAPGPTLRVLPALGGSVIYSDTVSQSPAWNFNGRELAYTQNTGAGPQIILFDTVSGLTRTLFAGHDPRLPAPAATLAALWSPAGDQFLISYSVVGDDNSLWAGLLSYDGRHFQPLPAPAARGRLYADGFSTDGQFLSAALYAGGDTSTAIYSAQDGSLQQSISGWWPQGWSAEGHTLALLSLDGASLLREPADPHSAPVRFGPPGCYQVIWRPLT